QQHYDRGGREEPGQPEEHCHAVLVYAPARPESSRAQCAPPGLGRREPIEAVSVLDVRVIPDGAQIRGRRIAYAVAPGGALGVVDTVHPVLPLERLTGRLISARRPAN